MMKHAFKTVKLVPPVAAVRCIVSLLIQDARYVKRASSDSSDGLGIAEGPNGSMH